jgi:hypothetical protein
MAHDFLLPPGTAIGGIFREIVVAYVSPSDRMIIPGIARDSSILAKTIIRDFLEKEYKHGANQTYSRYDRRRSEAGRFL